MKKSRQIVELVLTPSDNRRLADLCGELDAHLRHIERYIGVEINNRGNVFQIIGTAKSVHKTSHLLETLYQETVRPDQMDVSKIRAFLHKMDQEEDASSLPADYSALSIQTRQLRVQPRNRNQYHYLKNIQSHDINFGVGPSGTGKTWLAVACAVAALEADQVQRIILVRPAVEAGEHLGFLPGDMSQKVDPYLRPLYDALYEMVGIEHVEKLIQRNVIELAPLAFMRGRTLNDAFIILDEGQNTTREQMKMFLTRIGFGSRAVITGDITQIDLPNNAHSGLRHAIAVLSEVKDIHFTFFQAHDVVRHPLVQLIIQAYEKIEK